MAATFTCPNCGKSGSIKKEIPPGAKIRCSGCQTSFSPRPAQERASDVQVSDKAIKDFLEPPRSAHSALVPIHDDASVAGTPPQPSVRALTPISAGLFFGLGVATLLLCFGIYLSQKRSSPRGLPREEVTEAKERVTDRRQSGETASVKANDARAENSMNPPSKLDRAKQNQPITEEAVSVRVDHAPAGNPPRKLVPPEQNQPVKVDYVNSIGMRFVRIPAGTFSMGSGTSGVFSDQDEVPSHRVTISQSFLLGVYEVTQREYVTVTDANPSWFARSGKGSPDVDQYVQQSVLQSADTSNHPVENVTWEEAVGFCRKLSLKESKTYRLPTEAEWEYACRAGASTRFSFGEDADRLRQFAWTAQ